MIVIAIIGILASIVLVALNGAKKRAHAARALASASSVVSAVTICGDGNYFSPAADMLAPDHITAGGGYICENCQDVSCPQWPALSGGWFYSLVMKSGDDKSASNPALQLSNPSGTQCINCDAVSKDTVGCKKENQCGSVSH